VHPNSLGCIACLAPPRRVGRPSRPRVRSRPREQYRGRVFHAITRKYGYTRLESELTYSINGYGRAARLAGPCNVACIAGAHPFHEISLQAFRRIARTAIRHDVMHASGKRGRDGERARGIEETLSDLRLVENCGMQFIATRYSHAGWHSLQAPASRSPRWPRALKLISRDFFCRESAARTAFWHDTTGEIGVSKSLPSIYFISMAGGTCGSVAVRRRMFDIKSRKDCAYRSIAKSPRRGSWMKQMYHMILHWKNYYFNKNLMCF